MKLNQLNLFRPLVYFLIIAVFISFSGCRVKEAPVAKQQTENVELTYYKLFDDPDVMEEIINNYESQNPNVKINYRYFDDYLEYERVILNELAEGRGPDIFSMPNSWFISNYRKVAPMPSSLGSVASFESTFVDVARRDLVRPDDSGLDQIYALPMTVDTLAIYYNKDHFEDRNPITGKPAVTWDGIMEDVVLLNKVDNSFSRFEVSGLAMGRADNISNAVDVLYLLFLDYGVKFYNSTISDVTLAAQGGLALKALEFYTSFADPAQRYYSWNEFVAEAESPYPEVDAFVQGKVSMIFGYSDTYQLILDRIKALKADGVDVIEIPVVKVAPTPQLEDPAVSQSKRVAYASYFAETVSRTSKNPDVAWDFIIFMTLRDNLQTYFKELKRPTSRRDLIEKQRQDPVYGVFASQVGYAESFPIIDYARYSNLFIDLIGKANDGSVDNRELQQVQSELKNLLPKDGYLPNIDN